MGLVFGSDHFGLAPIASDEQALSAAIMSYWGRLGASGDPGTFLLVVSSLLLLVYATGTYRLVWVVTGHRAAALLVALVSLRGNTDVSGTGWGVFLGTAPPRSFPQRERLPGSDPARREVSAW